MYKTSFVTFVTVVVFVIFEIGPFVASSDAQTVTQRGFADARLTFFPQDAATDTVNAVGDFLLRDDVFAKPAEWLRLAGGADVRANTHDQVERAWRIDVDDRRPLRPAISLRRATATITYGALTVDIGRQFVRWGRTDIVAPTDRFAPRDFLDVIDADFLGVSALRVGVGRGVNTVDVVWQPWFTPSRVPLLRQRWTPTAVPSGIVVDDAGAEIPGGSQVGARWNHVGDRFEAAVSAFDGFNHLPILETALSPELGHVGLIRRYPTLRSIGGDVAVPARLFTIKGETAYFSSDTPHTDDYVLYVVQLERQSGEWVFVGGYAGEAVTARRSISTFAPDRGLTRAIVGRASYTIDANRTASFEAAVRQNGRGAYAKAEYSQARGQHLRVTIAAIGIAGRDDDFLGQYRRNSHGLAAVRYSF